MIFSVEYYRTESGVCPVREFLDDMWQRDPDDCVALMAALRRLRIKDCHRPPMSKPIGDALFELRHLGKLNSRMLYFFVKGQRIIVVHGIRNKANSIPDRDRQTAIRRMKDWLARNP